MLAGDIGNRLFDRFKEQAPWPLFQLRKVVAEATMTGVAAVLAASGMRPLPIALRQFKTVRCLEQIPPIELCILTCGDPSLGTGSGPFVVRQPGARSTLQWKISHLRGHFAAE